MRRFWANPAAPLLVWAGYFLFVYVAQAIACARYPTATVLPVLWVASLAALAVTLVMGGAFFRGLRQEDATAPERRLVLRTGLLLSIIALIAITWTALPILLVEPCR